MWRNGRKEEEEAGLINGWVVDFYCLRAKLARCLTWKFEAQAFVGRINYSFDWMVDLI
jgi:hypothetical protein